MYSRIQTHGKEGPEMVVARDSPDISSATVDITRNAATQLTNIVKVWRVAILLDIGAKPLKRPGRMPWRKR